jgi:hypothetical protein
MAFVFNISLVGTNLIHDFLINPIPIFDWNRVGVLFGS